MTQHPKLWRARHYVEENSSWEAGGRVWFAYYTPRPNRWRLKQWRGRARRWLSTEINREVRELTERMNLMTYGDDPLPFLSRYKTRCDALTARAHVFATTGVLPE